MGRLLVLILVIALVAIIVVKLVKGRAAGAPPLARRDERVPSDDETRLVRCVRCGAYVPRGEALPAPDGPRCGDPACAP